MRRQLWVLLQHLLNLCRFHHEAHLLETARRVATVPIRLAHQLEVHEVLKCLPKHVVGKV